LFATSICFDDILIPTLVIGS